MSDISYKETEQKIKDIRGKLSISLLLSTDEKQKNEITDKLVELDLWERQVKTMKGEDVMSAEQMRARILEVYPNSTKWAKRVEKMSDNQVIAIYYNMLEKGQIK